MFLKIQSIDLCFRIRREWRVMYEFYLVLPPEQCLLTQSAEAINCVKQRWRKPEPQFHLLELLQWVGSRVTTAFGRRASCVLAEFELCFRVQSRLGPVKPAWSYSAACGRSGNWDPCTVPRPGLFLFFFTISLRRDYVFFNGR